MCYAVGCGFYQLHGEEGEKKGLKGEIGDKHGRSVKTESLAGDYRDTVIDTGRRASGAQRKKGSSAGTALMLDEPDITETSESEEESREESEGQAEEALSKTAQYARGVENFLSDALRPVKEVATSEETNVPGGTRKRYNEIKNAWANLARDTEPAVMKRIRE